jgi:predicted DNA-binding transcriptional regulator AlpA
MTQTNSPERKLVTKPELAARYGVVVRTIDNWIALRQVPFLKIGKKMVRFDVAECDAALQRFKINANAD